MILTFASDDDYYRYVSAYFSEALRTLPFNEVGHFVFPHEDMWRRRPVIAHELFHATVAHLPLPAWLNEGLAANAGFRFGSRYEGSAPRERAIATSPRVLERSCRLQDFWSREAPPAGANEARSCSTICLRRLVVGLSADWGRMKQFIATADAPLTQAGP